MEVERQRSIYVLDSLIVVDFETRMSCLVNLRFFFRLSQSLFGSNKLENRRIFLSPLNSPDSKSHNLSSSGSFSRRSESEFSSDCLNNGFVVKP